ncbi:MAG: outer membrane protein assembly factor BamA [Rhodospirillales bacterium]|nr:outer membrane protein assembly factor BamA [Rhodospirillales bacterium]
MREIVVEGAQRIEPDTIRSYMLVQEGDPYDPERVDRSLKTLFATGLFADVSLRRQGDKLFVRVVENPVINRIAFEGNKRLNDEELSAEVTLRSRVIYTRTKVQSDVNRILTLYRRSGRFAATVEPKVIQLPQNRIDLIFEIGEGDLTEVERIRFVGNKEFSDSRLREIIRTKETRWYRFFTSDDTYDPDRMTLDRELLRRFYLKNGFADSRVISAVAELTPNREDFFLTFTVDEGARYRFGTIDVEARLRDLDPQELRENLELEEGEWYNADDIEDASDDLADAVGEKGYAFVDVRPRIVRDRPNRTINITFEIGEGPRVFVERIDITGNVRTLDKVVRREFRLVEGDAFNLTKLRRSKQRIQNLGFFEKVELEQVPGSASDKTVLNVDVEEKSTGALSIGAGFSSTNGALVDFGIRERNLLGRGQDLNLKVTAAQRKSQVDLSFTEPYFLDREVRAGFDIFSIKADLQDTSSHDLKSLGTSFRIGYPITESITQGWKYTIEQTDVTNVSSSASQFIQLQEGTELLSEISHSLTYDKRDNRLDPTEGHFARLTTDLAGLGGSTRYIRNRLNGGKYYSLGDEYVLGLTSSAGYILGIGKDVNLADRFFIGGNEVRGFADAGLGPRDRGTKDALGGEWMYSASAELVFPIGLPNELGIKAKVFTDLGSSGKLSPSSSDIHDSGAPRASIGTGIRWISPFGAIGIDLGFPVLKESFDEIENLRFNFGTKF